MNYIAILKGNFNSFFNFRTEEMKRRELVFCRKCPISHINGKYNGVCNVENGGCGCKIKAKTSQNEEPCPKGFWTNIESFNDFIEKNENYI